MVIPNRRVGIVLFQLGGPDTLEAIEPFLYNLFCDPDIIDFPFARIGRKPLAKLISTTRARKVQHHYSVIGGGSPIRRFTEQQARALESRLNDSGIDARCFVAMRYWHPFTAEAIAQLEAAGCDEVVLLPLYPHYSSTTTGSSLNEWNRLYRRKSSRFTQVGAFYRNDLYLEALVEKIDEALAPLFRSRASRDCFQRAQRSRRRDRTRRPLPASNRRDRRTADAPGRLDERSSPLLPEQSRRQQVVAALTPSRPARPVAGKSS